jgi:hypothetical protein
MDSGNGAIAYVEGATDMIADCGRIDEHSRNDLAANEFV